MTKGHSIGKWRRTKGISFEREIAIMLRTAFPKVRRHLEYQDAEAFGVDLVETGYYRIQCKRLKAYVSVNTIKEVKCDEFLGEVPVLVTKADKARILAVLPFEELVRLLEFERKVSLDNRLVK